jgi:hypothetical protein
MTSRRLLLTLLVGGVLMQAGCSLPTPAGYSFCTPQTCQVSDCSVDFLERFLVLSSTATNELASFYQTGKLGNVTGMPGPLGTMEFLCASASWNGLIVDALGHTQFVSVSPGGEAVKECDAFLATTSSASQGALKAVFGPSNPKWKPNQGMCLEFYSASLCDGTYIPHWDVITPAKDNFCSPGPPGANGFLPPP